MKTLFISLFLSTSLLLSGCVTSSSLNKEKQENISQGAYAINDSINMGRFDLAKQYSDQLDRLITPPKTRIVVKPFQLSRGNH